MIHPSVLVAAWMVGAVVLQALSFAMLTAVAAFSLLAALRFARQRSVQLLKRSRWLLLSIAVLFLFFTPGEYLSGWAGQAGISREGLERAISQLSLLVAMLTSLALLHERLGTTGIIVGLYRLTKPFIDCERTLVRLLLAIEAIEQKAGGDWRNWLIESDAEVQSESLRILAPEMDHSDRVALALLGGVPLLLWLAP